MTTMREIDAATAADYLRETGRIPEGAEVRVRELSGGVSNIVLRVDVSGQSPYVIKQCRERLRVAMDWRAPLDRIWTESATLSVLGEILPEGMVPHVLFEDRPEYLFAMTCAPEDSVTWKSLLMEGVVDPAIAERAGHDVGDDPLRWGVTSSAAGILADTSLFEHLRVDPYYRTVAVRHPDLAPRIDALIAEMERPPGGRTLVLGDFSPKNILVHAGGLVLLDFECAHAGDPAFDLGFFLTHLMLKEIRVIAAGDHDAPRYLGLTRGFWDAVSQATRARDRRDRGTDPAVRPAYVGVLPGTGRRQEPGRVSRPARPDPGSIVRPAVHRGRAVHLGRIHPSVRQRGGRGIMATLKGLRARQVLDSRGRPTVEVEATTKSGAVGRAIVPSGASTGRHEAIELRDVGSLSYGGLGVLSAVENVNRLIAPELAGIDLDDQPGLDARLIALDGTSNKGRLGANALLGVSLAVAHAAASDHGEELFVHLNRLFNERIKADPAGLAPCIPTLPLPMVNMISGGLHAGGNLDIQDILIIAVGASSYSEALERSVALYRAVGAILGKAGLESALVGDEGGYGPRLRDAEHAFAVVVDAIIACGMEPGQDVAIAVDVASTHFHDPDHGTYRIGATADRELDSTAMVDLLAGWVERYPIISLEDGLAEDDWDGWTRLTDRLGGSVQLIGDDLFTTQVDRLKTGIDRRAGNAILVKLNQVGTLTETFDALGMARAMVSVRSSRPVPVRPRTPPSPTWPSLPPPGRSRSDRSRRSERLSKYNRLLRIEEALGPDATFARPFS